MVFLVIAQPHFQKPSLILLDSRQTGVWFALASRAQAFENVKCTRKR
jgi:hypothetical protein